MVFADGCQVNNTYDIPNIQNTQQYLVQLLLKVAD